MPFLTRARQPDERFVALRRGVGRTPALPSRAIAIVADRSDRDCCCRSQHVPNNPASASWRCGNQSIGRPSLLNRAIAIVADRSDRDCRCQSYHVPGNHAFVSWRCGGVSVGRPPCVIARSRSLPIAAIAIAVTNRSTFRQPRVRSVALRRDVGRCLIARSRLLPIPAIANVIAIRTTCNPIERAFGSAAQSVARALTPA